MALSTTWAAGNTITSAWANSVDTAVNGLVAVGTAATQTAHAVLVGPITGSAAPTFRALVASDIPSLGTSQIGTGTPTASYYVDGGTGAWTALPSTTLTAAAISAALWASTTSGSANTYTASVPTAPTLTAGLEVNLIFNVANTGASTLNLNSLGAKNIYYNGAAVASGRIVTGRIYTLVYDGTQWEITSIAPLGAADLGTGTATSSYFLRGDLTWSNTLAGALTVSSGGLTISAGGAAVTGGVVVGAADTASSTSNGLWGTSTGPVLNAVSGKSVIVNVAGTAVLTVAGAAVTCAQALTVSTGGVTLTAGNLTLGTAGAASWGSSAGTGTINSANTMMANLSTGLAINVPTGKNCVVQVAGTTVATLASTGLTLASPLSVGSGGAGVSLASTGGTGQYLKQATVGGNITVGTIAMADLGTGTPSSSNYLRGDGSWQPVSAGSVALSALTAGTLGVTLNLGSQTITSTANSSWYNATGKYLQFGSGTSPTLMLGQIGTSQSDYYWSLGGYASNNTGYSAIHSGIYSADSHIHYYANSGYHLFTGALTADIGNLVLTGGAAVAGAILCNDRLQVAAATTLTNDPGSGGIYASGNIISGGSVKVGASAAVLSSPSTNVHVRQLPKVALAASSNAPVAILSTVGSWGTITIIDNQGNIVQFAISSLTLTQITTNTTYSVTTSPAAGKIGLSFNSGSGQITIWSGSGWSGYCWAAFIDNIQ